MGFNFTNLLKEDLYIGKITENNIKNLGKIKSNETIHFKELEEGDFVIGITKSGIETFPYRLIPEKTSITVGNVYYDHSPGFHRWTHVGAEIPAVVFVNQFNSKIDVYYKGQLVGILSPNEPTYFENNTNGFRIYDLIEFGVGKSRLKVQLLDKNIGKIYIGGFS